MEEQNTELQSAANESEQPNPALTVREESPQPVVCPEQPGSCASVIVQYSNVQQQKQLGLSPVRSVTSITPNVVPSKPKPKKKSSNSRQKFLLVFEEQLLTDVSFYIFFLDLVFFF